MTQLGFDFLVRLAFALLIVTALVALPFAIVRTLRLIRRFRGQVEQSMRAAAGATAHLEPDRTLPSGPQGELEIEPIGATRERANAARAAPLVAEARRHVRHLAALYAAAAGAYPLLLAAAFIVNLSPTHDMILLTFALVYSLSVLQFGTPVALAPTMVLKKQPRFLFLAVLALIFAIWAWGRSIGVDDPIGLWLMIAGFPTGAVLLLNTRRLRAIGPIVFARTLLLLYGLCAGVAYATFYAWDAVGPGRFVRDDLAQLPLVVAAERYAAWLLSLPLDQMRAEVSALISSPSSVIQLENPDGLTTEVQLHFFAIWLFATAIGMVAAWMFIRWFAWRYQARRASDQMLTIDVLMVIFTVPMFLVFSASSMWIEAAGALAGFIGYKLVARWSLRRRQRSTPVATARTLLLLRVFGFDGRTQRLLEDLGQSWRYLGPIRLIGGTDAAYTTIEPHEFFEFLNGRLTRAFVKDRDDLERRLSGGTAAPDPDGLFRIEGFYCHENSWRMTVSRLARDADAVLMDLRGFTPVNRGCVFEIEQLIASVPLHRIVLLVDGSTDVPFLEQTLQGAWRNMPNDSPNAVAGKRRLRILHASSSPSHTLDTLLGLLCERFGERAAATPALAPAPTGA